MSNMHLCILIGLPMANLVHFRTLLIAGLHRQMNKTHFPGEIEQQERTDQGWILPVYVAQ